MARIKDGVLGAFEGKAGPIIGYRVRGKYFVRSVPKAIGKTASAKQLANRARFKLMQAWRSQFTDFFAISFKNHTHERSAQNAAHHFNTQIVKGEYPDFEIDYPSVVISRGTLPGLTELQTTLTGTCLRLTWEPRALDGAKHNDLIAILVIYDQFDYFQSDLGLATRNSGKAAFELAFPNGCQTAHVYITVLANDRERASNSTYLSLQANNPL